jgi:hypothetical protein
VRLSTGALFYCSIKGWGDGGCSCDLLKARFTFSPTQPCRAETRLVTALTCSSPDTETRLSQEGDTFAFCEHDRRGEYPQR